MELEKSVKEPDSLNILELACLRLMEKRIPRKTIEHSQALLYIMNSCFYKSQEEISLALGIQSNKLSVILDSLARKKIVHKTGCLYKPKCFEEIQEILK